jgi:uncharacterized membrane protein YfcA
MLEHYKKRFLGMQSFIAFIVIAVYFAMNHRVVPAAIFFATMQIGALVGAAWAARLTRRIQGRVW